MTTRPDQVSFGEMLADLGRESISVALVLLLLIPAAIIRLADWITLWWIRRRGGLD